MNITTGQLVSSSLEFKGSSGFPVNTVELTVNGRPVEFRATGATAQAVQTLLDGAEVGTIVRVLSNPVFRTYEKDGELRAIYDMEIADVQLLGTIGAQESTFSVQGFVKDIEEIAGKKGVFYSGNISVIAYDRDGNFIENADIQVTIEDDLVPIWRAAIGKLAIVGGRFNGYKNDNGRIWPRWYAETVSAVMDVPAWLDEVAPTGAVVAAPAPAAAPAASVPPF